MKALGIALKDMQVLLKDRGAVVQLFLLPLFFVLTFTALYDVAQVGQGRKDTLPLFPVVNLDVGGAASQEFIDRLQRSGGVQVQVVAEEEAQTLLKQAKIVRLLTIPAGFSADVAAGRQATVRLVTHPDVSEVTAEAVLRTVQSVAMDLSLETRILAGLRQMGAMRAGSDTASAFGGERLIAQARSQFERSKTTPLVSVDEVRPASLPAPRVEYSPVQVGVPGFTILFVFLAAQTTAGSIYEEKKQGSFRRLLAAPVSKASLLVGKMLPNLITALIQITVVFASGVLLLPLLGLGGITLGRDPLALVLLSGLVALCSTGLGLVIAAIARTEAQIGGVSAVALWIMSILGGCIVPLFLFSGTLGSIGQVVPQYWANQAYYDLLVRGRVLADILPRMGVLAGFTVLFFAIGLWRFEFE
jgi:ABC-2 type transport system permease protein